MYPSFSDIIPKKKYTDKCIVLDIDETLVYTHEEFKDLEHLKLFSDSKYLDLRRRTYRFHLNIQDEDGNPTILEMSGISRPHVEDFLSFCFQYFSVVAIWSAGQKPYVEAICDFLFRDLKKPDLIWTAEDCTPITDSKGRLIGVEKPLDKMYKYFYEKTNGRIRMNETNTFILDDRLITFERTNPYNGILIPNYHPSATIESMRKDDPTLPELEKWLNNGNVIYSRDVRTLVKNNIFSTPNDQEDY